jgi:hypothetical protein
MSVKTLEEHVAAFAAFMDLFGKRAAALYSVFCVVACVIPAVILLIWSPTALFSSVVSIVWMGGLFIVGGICLWCELNEEQNSKWALDLGEAFRPSSSQKVPAPPKMRSVAVLFIAVANGMMIFINAYDRCTEIGGSVTRSFLLLFALLINAVCQFTYTLVKWGRNVKKERVDPTKLELTVPETQLEEEALTKVASNKGEEGAQLATKAQEKAINDHMVARFSHEPNSDSTDQQQPFNEKTMLKTHREGGKYRCKKDKGRTVAIVEFTKSKYLEQCVSAAGLPANIAKWEVKAVIREKGGLLAQFQEEIESTKAERVHPNELRWTSYFCPVANATQLVAFCFFWANITAISFVPDIKWGLPGKFLGGIWQSFGDILKLTLFDIDWPNWTIPSLDIEISALSTYIVQFAIAVVCAVMFPVLANKYREFFKDFAKIQDSLASVNRDKKSALDRLKKVQEETDGLVNKKDTLQIEETKVSQKVSARYLELNEAENKLLQTDEKEKEIKTKVTAMKEQVKLAEQLRETTEAECEQLQALIDTAIAGELDQLERNKQLEIDCREAPNICSKPCVGGKMCKACSNKALVNLEAVNLGNLANAQMHLEAVVKVWAENELERREKNERSARAALAENREFQTQASAAIEKLEGVDIPAAEAKAAAAYKALDEYQAKSAAAAGGAGGTEVTTFIEVEFEKADVGSKVGDYFKAVGITLPEKQVGRCVVEAVSGAMVGALSKAKSKGVQVDDEVIGVGFGFHYTQGFGKLNKRWKGESQLYHAGQFEEQDGPSNKNNHPQRDYLWKLMEKCGYKKQGGSYINEVIALESQGFLLIIFRVSVC